MDSVVYTFDVLGRLSTATFSSGTVITWNYDSVGNLTSIVTSCPSGTC
jgi:YD repeat-containing protein